MNTFASIGLILAFAVAASAIPYPSIDDNILDEDDVEWIDLSHFGSSIFREPSNQTGLLVASYDPNTNDLNPEEMGEYLEGDILIPHSLGRNGLIATASHWPGAIVPFEIRGYFGETLFAKSFYKCNGHRSFCIYFIRTERTDDLGCRRW